MAFKIAVDWINSDETLLKNSRVIANVEKIFTDDSFKATKISCSLLQNGVAAIVGPQSELTSMHVQSICDDLEVPHIKTRWDYKLSREQLYVNLYPHPSVLTRAFLRFLEIWNWREFFYVYEEDYAVIRMKDFLSEGEKRNWTIRLFKFPDTTSYRDVFWEMKVFTKIKRSTEDNVEHQIVLDVHRDNLYKVLKAAQQVGMMTERQKYLITSLDIYTVDMEDFQYSKTNITGLRLVQEDTAEFIGLLQEVNHRLERRRNSRSLTTLKTETALIYDSVKLLAVALEQMDAAKEITVFPPISCNLMNKGVDGTSLINFMKNVKMSSPGLSGLLEFDSEGFRSRFSLDVMYLTSHGLKKIGTILPGNQVNITTPGTSDFKYLELENMHFRVSTYLNDPYTMLKVSSEEMRGNDQYEGFCIDVMNDLADLLHFKYDLHRVKDGKYGAQEDDGTWNGMIGEVVYGEADLAIVDLTITANRLKGVDFTLPFMQTGISILFKKPTEKSTSLFSFLLPFSGEVWILIVVSYCFISLCLFLIGRMSPYEWANPYPCRKSNMVEGNVFSLLNSMWWAIGNLLQQGSDVMPTASSTRALTSTWSFFKLIMISSYTANLASFLTIEKLESPINSVEELAAQEKIQYGCVESGSTDDFFKGSNITTYQKMYKYMQSHKEVYVNKSEYGIERVKQGNYAYLMEATSIEYNVERECNLTQIGGLLDLKGYGIALKKGDTKLRSWLSEGILQLQENGKIQLYKEKWWKQKKGGGKCSGAKSSGSANELGLGNVGGVILVMILGMFLAMFVGVVEFFWFQRKLKRRPEESLCRLFFREVKYAITCGSSSRNAPKLRRKGEEELANKERDGYTTFS